MNRTRMASVEEAFVMNFNSSKESVVMNFNYYISRRLNSRKRTTSFFLFVVKGFPNGFLFHKGPPFSFNERSLRN